MQNTFDVALIGEYFFDMIYTGLPEFPVLGREVYSQALTTTGGGMFITAAALRRLDVRVGWPVTFGDDPYSRTVYAFAEGEGVDLALARVLERPFRHVTTSINFGDERAFVSFADPDPDDLCAYRLRRLEESDFAHLHFGGLIAPPDRPLLDLARARGVTVSMDCQDAAELYTGCEWIDLLSKVDVFMPNAREAKLITRKDTVQEALKRLMRWVDTVIVKDGCHGAWAGRGGEVVYAPVCSTGTAIDTTGAGDCFNAGFLRGYVVERAPLDVCLQYGNICGARSVTAVGGATAAPTLDELRGWLDRCPAEAVDESD